MVYRRPMRVIEGPDRDRLLDAMGRCRKIVTDLSCRLEYGSPTYRALDTVKGAIDGVAKMVTGDGKFYWDRGSVTPRAWTDKGTR